MVKKLSIDGKNICSIKNLEDKKNFINRKSTNSIEIRNVIFEGNLIGASPICYYKFIGCEFKGKIQISGENIDFEKCIFYENSGKNDDFNGGGYEFKECIFNRYFELSKNIVYGYIFFIDSKFQDLNIRHLTSLGIIFSNTTFGKLKIEGINGIKNKRNIQNELKIGSLNIGTPENAVISIIGNNIKLTKVEIQDIRSIDEIEIGAIEGILEVEKIRIKNINLNDKSSLKIYNTLIQEVEFSEFFNNTEKNIIQDSRVIKYLDIKNSDLGRTKFNGVEIGKLTLENATLNDCIFNGVDFQDYNLGNKGVSSKKIKDNYRQLKYVMDKNGNHTEANKFFAKEMEYYEKTLGIENKSIFDVFKSSHLEGYRGENTKKLGEKIVLMFSKGINDFGNNWIRPAFLLLMLAFGATIIDFGSGHLGISMEFFSKTYGDIIGDLLVIPLFLLIPLIDIKYNTLRNIGKNIDYLLDNFIYFLVFIIVSLFCLDLFTLGNFHSSFSVFSNYLTPLGLLPEYFIENGEKIYIKYNGIEDLAFVTYKILYGILLWHLIIAAKRTTKR